MVKILAAGGFFLMLVRLLAAAGGGGGFHPPGLAADDGWTKQGTVLAPSDAWEQTSIQEPIVVYEGGSYKMWAKGGWASTALGYYTSADGVSWSRYVSNPVLGGGGSGFAPEISQPFVRKFGSTYWCWFNSGGDSDPNTPRYATSTDGIAWTVGGSGSYVTNPGLITQWGNRTVWVEGATWYQLLEARQASEWRIFYATSADGASWTLGNSSNYLSTLKPAGADHSGGIDILQPALWGGLYQLYYHAGATVNSDLYRATSTDKITWTITNSGNPILTHTGSDPEEDQIADPSLLLVDGTWKMWYAAVDNTGETGVIRLATASPS